MQSLSLIHYEAGFFLGINKEQESLIYGVLPKSTQDYFLATPIVIGQVR